MTERPPQALQHPALRDGLAALRAGRVEQAIGLLSRVPPVAGPGYLEARQALLPLLREARDPEALSQFVAQSQQGLGDPTLLFRFAETLFQTGLGPLAEPLYARVLQLDASYTDAYIRLGMLWREKRDLARATQYLERALQLDQKAVVARFVLAHICFDQANYPRALSQLHFVLTIRPDSGAARMLRAEIHQRLGDHRQALVELCHLANEGSRDPQVYLKLVASFAALNDDTQQHMALERTFALDSSHLMVALKLATCYEAEGDLPRSAHYYRAVLHEDPAQPRALQGYERVRARSFQVATGSTDEPPADYDPTAELALEVEALFELPFTAPQERTHGDQELALPPLNRLGTGNLGGRARGTAPLGPERRLAPPPGAPERRQIPLGLHQAPTVPLDPGRGGTSRLPTRAPTAPIPVAPAPDALGDVLDKIQAAATDFWARARRALENRPPP